jgi:hypothetical protein
LIKIYKKNRGEHNVKVGIRGCYRKIPAAVAAGINVDFFAKQLQE